MMTSLPVVETSVNVTANSPFQDYTHPDDHTLTDLRRVWLQILETYWQAGLLPSISEYFVNKERFLTTHNRILTTLIRYLLEMVS